MHPRIPTSGLLGLSLLLAISPPLGAQQRFQLAPVPATGGSIAPIFDGWYANPDGTFTLSFGYFNENREETVDVPLGPDNFVEPRELDGRQPTTFTPRQERGVFAIVVPAEFANRDVVWTINHGGRSHSVPGRVTAPAYQLTLEPMALGSMPPALRFEPNGQAGRGPVGIEKAGELRTEVGQPVEIAVWGEDDASLRQGADAVVPLGVTWFKHAGPGAVEFDTAGEGEGAFDAAGRTSARISFSQPGEYVVRVRVDNFEARDSQAVDQCCWTNGYVRVVVSE